MIHNSFFYLAEATSGVGLTGIINCIVECLDKLFRSVQQSPLAPECGVALTITPLLREGGERDHMPVSILNPGSRCSVCRFVGHWSGVNDTFCRK